MYFINKNIVRIIELLQGGRLYFNELHELSGITSKNNLLKNLNILTENKLLFVKKNKSNTYYSLNFSNQALLSILNLINQSKFENLPFNVKKSILTSILILKPKMAVLFGSYAKLSHGKDSDVDLLFFDSQKISSVVSDISSKYNVKLNIIFLEFEGFVLNDTLRHIFKSGYPLVGCRYFYDEFKKIQLEELAQK